MSTGDLIRAAESGGDNYAKNPRSSATGPDQFIASTWLDTIRVARPDLVHGKTDAELLALRTNPEISGQVRDTYTAQNRAILSQAGHAVTPGTDYLSHFAGPQGAVSVLNADPAAPAASVMGAAAMKANPFLQGMTVGDLRAWADRKMGGAQPAPQAAPPPPNGLLSAVNYRELPRSTDFNASAPLNLMPQQQAPPIFAPQQQAQAAPFEAPQAMQSAPIFMPQRKKVDISRLRAAFQAPQFPTRG